jgi:secretion/DNA translocation related TadE-like protein
MLAASALLASAVVTRHRAQAAADLAALAAADVALGRRPGDPCALATAVAAANGGRLVSCTVEGGGDAVVGVEVRPPGAAAQLGTARVSARAGPAP